MRLASFTVQRTLVLVVVTNRQTQADQHTHVQYVELHTLSMVTALKHCCQTAVENL